MIEICSLSKSYGSRKVLNDFNLSITRGSITGIVGPNACGKTTLIKCILGLCVASSGKILLEHKELDQQGQFRRRIGYMPQTPSFPANLSLVEFLIMSEDLRNEKALDKDYLLEYFNLKSILNQPFGQLSGGTKQKVAAVIAFMFDAPLIILDEPTVGLDPLTSVHFKELVLKKSKSGTTIILVSHIMAEIEKMATQMAFMDEGKVAFAGCVSEIVRRSGANDLENAVVHLFEHSSKRLI